LRVWGSRWGSFDECDVHTFNLTQFLHRPRETLYCRLRRGSFDVCGVRTSDTTQVLHTCVVCVHQTRRKFYIDQRKRCAVIFIWGPRVCMWGARLTCVGCVPQTWRNTCIDQRKRCAIVLHVGHFSVSVGLCWRVWRAYLRDDALPTSTNGKAGPFCGSPEAADAVAAPHYWNSYEVWVCIYICAYACM